MRDIKTKDALLALCEECERECEPIMKQVDARSFAHTERVLAAFRNARVAEGFFAPSTGYGYDDAGRAALDRIYAEVFESESAFVRHSIASGTHALTIALFGMLRPGDELLIVSGEPYDTIQGVIKANKGEGSLTDFGISYKIIDLLPSNEFDYEKIEKALTKKTKAVYVQRSRGYASRPALMPESIGKLSLFVHEKSSAIVFVDNCYGEFVCDHEPTYYGADLMAGSLIKNPGGGMADCGGYIAGRKDLVELCSYRLTCPGIGLEIGASLGQNKNILKGFFYAPHTVAAALKTAIFAARLYGKLGYDATPAFDERRSDIIESIVLKSPEALCAFCRGIQAGSPIDAHAAPVPAPMPGYEDDVIMAAGAFTQGASIELSADGPLREPYTAYMQGALTYESGKIGIIYSALEVLGLK